MISGPGKACPGISVYLWMQRQGKKKNVSRETMEENADSIGENCRFGFPERCFVRKVLPETALDFCFCRGECRRKEPQCTASGRMCGFFRRRENCLIEKGEQGKFPVRENDIQSQQSLSGHFFISDRCEGRGERRMFHGKQFWKISVNPEKMVSLNFFGGEKSK